MKKSQIAKKERPRKEVMKGASNVLPTLNNEDALAGVMSEKTFVLSQNSEGKRHRVSRRHWSYNPPARCGYKLGPQRDPEVHVHRDGYTTAHPGSLAADVRPGDLESTCRAAGLTAQEQAVLLADAAGTTYVDIARQVGISFFAVKRRLVSGTKKKEAYAAALAKMGGV